MAKKPIKLNKSLRITLTVLGCVLALVLVCVIAAQIIIHHYLGKINIVTTETYDSYEEMPTQTPVATQEETKTQAPTQTQTETKEENQTQTTPQPKPIPQPLNLPLITDTEDVKNILLIATDARGNEAGRSDTMILLSVNEKTKKIVMCSFMRDSLAILPNGVQDKLTHAHAYGGADLTLQTFKKSFNIDIDHYVKITFYSFMKVIDAVGGLDVEMTASEVEVMNMYLLEINELLGRPVGTDNLAPRAGTYHLNGAQALGYARNRYSGGDDWKRTDRQRIIIGKVIDKAKTLSLGEFDKLLDTCLPLVTTNIPKNTLAQYVNSAFTYIFYERESFAFPMKSWSYQTINGISYIVPNYEVNCRALYEKIYGTPAP